MEGLLTSDTDQHATQSTPAGLIRQHKGLFDEQENTATLNNILDFWTKKASETLVNIVEGKGMEVLRQKKSFEVERLCHPPHSFQPVLDNIIWKCPARPR